MNKKALLTASFIIIIIFISSVAIKKWFPNDQIIWNDDNFSIEADGWVKETKPIITTSDFSDAFYTYYDFYKSDKHFQLTVAEIDNNILFFARNFNDTPNNVINLKINAQENMTDKITQLNRDNKTWELVTKNEVDFSKSVYISGDRLHLRLGMADTFTPLGYSVIENIKTDNSTISSNYTNDSTTYTIPIMANEESFSETWGVLATKPIINWDNENEASMAVSNEFSDIKKLLSNGAFYETPDSYLPYTANSYYLNPANLDGLRSLNYSFNNDSGVIFKLIATHLAYAAVLNQNEHGFWATEPLSEWLHNDYGISYNYMDNRRNIDNSIFLLRYYKETKNSLVFSSLKKWMEYHLEYIKKHAITIKNGGIFIPDYVESDKISKAHISLNHLAANLNYLLESYLKLKNDEQLAVAKELLLAIKNTKHLWVSDDHNLYYSLSQNLEPSSLDDYITLTRDDLEETQFFLTEIFGKRDEDIDFLIEQKNIWIENNHPAKL